MEGARRRLTASADAQFSGGGRITVRAAGTPTTTAPSGSPLHYRLDAEIRRLTSSLLGPPDSTQNRLNATLSADVEGPSLATLNGTADVRVTNMRSAGLQTPEITFASTLEDGAATLDLQGSLNGTRLRASGRARPLGEAPSADVTATVDALNVAAFAPDGGVESDLTATTNLRGRALGTDRQTVDVTTTLDSSRVGVQRIVDGRGTDPSTLRASTAGLVRGMQAGPFTIDTRAVRRALVDGTMTLQGSVQEPVLGGSLKMNNAEIFYNEFFAESGGAAAITLTDEDRLTLENQFGIRLAPADTTTSNTYEALEMDLSVRIQRDTWLRSRSSPEMDLEFEGDFDLDKAQSGDLQVFGSVQAVTRRSTLRQFGQEFQITDGTLTFNGDPTAPRIVLEAVYEQRARGNQESEVSITLNLTGRPGDLTPTLASDPPMATRNILSYLATGRPADELGIGGGGSGNMATQMALGQAADVVENIAARELGLDVVRVQIRPSGLSYLTVGRYLTPGLFASIQQPVTNAASATEQMSQYLPDLTLEYQPTDTLMLRTLKNQRSLQLNVLYEYAY